MNKRHDRAMDIAEQAFLERRKGDPRRAEALFEEAYRIEKDVALETVEGDIPNSRAISLIVVVCLFM